MTFTRQIKVNDTYYTVNLSSNNVHIVNSYKITSRKDMKEAIKQIRELATKLDISYKRSERSWLTEWRAHNLLYVCNFETARTKSVDLNEDETKNHIRIYKLLSFVYNFIH